MPAQDQSLQKYCTPIMFARFVYALFGFGGRKFPAKSPKKWDIFCWPNLVYIYKYYIIIAYIYRKNHKNVLFVK